MKKKVHLVMVIFTIFSLFVTPQLIEMTVANPINQKPIYEIVTIEYPQTIRYSSNDVSLNFTSQTNSRLTILPLSYTSYCCTLDGSGEVLYGEVWARMLKTHQRIISQTVISNDTPTFRSEPYLPYTDYIIVIKTTLSSLRDGNHKITLYKGPNYECSSAIYKPLCNAYFTINTSTDGTRTLRLFSISPTPSPTNSPLPTNTQYSPESSPSVPELSWLAIIPLMVFMLLIAIVFRRHRKTMNKVS
jgi:hypothetical protein